MRILEWPTYETSAAEIMVTREQAVARAEQALARILAQSPKARSFRSTLVALDALEHAFTRDWYRISLLENASPIPDVRDAARQAQVAMSNWHMENLRLDHELYRVIQEFAETPAADALRGEDRRLLEETLAALEWTGAALGDAERATLTDMRSRLSDLTTEILTNITEDEGIVALSRGELEGLGDEQLEAFEYDEAMDAYLVRTALATQYNRVMESAAQPETRRRTLVARMSRAKEANREPIHQVLVLRARMAELLGYDTWAAYQLARRMADSVQEVRSFLSTTAERLGETFRAEQRMLLDLKREELARGDAALRIEDIPYYTNMLRERSYGIDEQQVREYFAEDTLLRRIFDLYEALFSLVIELQAPERAWAEDVQVAVVSDAHTGRVLGAIYLDLHPRPGKFNHFASFTLVPGRARADGYQAPIAAIVGNWPEPTATRPALWSMRELSTMLHELGHAFHQISTTAKYYAFAGTNVPLDFVEVPSMLLERWLQDPVGLQRLAVHYRTGEGMPDELIARLIAAGDATTGHDYAWLTTRSMVDLAIHEYMDVGQVPDTPEAVYQTTNAVFDGYYYPLPEETAHLAAFLHPFGGYDAGYYTYMWSDAIAADIASRFRASARGFLDPVLGVRLRQEILEPGESRPVGESIRAFLGRDWSTDAFFEEVMARD